MLFVVFHDTPGALYNLLGIFAHQQPPLNLRDVTKAPLKKSISNQLRDWRCFEFEANDREANFEAAHKLLMSKKALAPVVKMAGTFRAAPLPS